MDSLFGRRFESAHLHNLIPMKIFTTALCTALFLTGACCSSTPETTGVRKEVRTATASNTAPFSQGIEANGFLFISGTLGVEATTGMLAGDDVVSQLTQIVKNISQILEEAGSSLKDVVKATVFLTDMQNYAAMNEAYLTLFQAPYPARTCVEISRLPRAGALIEVEVIAVKGK